MPVYGPYIVVTDDGYLEFPDGSRLKMVITPGTEKVWELKVQDPTDDEEITIVSV
jgi:hypothetical protein